MKKALVLIPVLYIVFILLVLGMITGGGSGGAGGIPFMATEEQAYDYQYIASETGIPWDMALLADVMLCEQEGLDTEDMSPLLSSLQFCMVTEIKNTGSWEPTDETDEEGHTVYELVWREEGRNYYYGLDGILGYLGITEADISEMDMAEIIQAVKEQGYHKEIDLTKYDAIFSSNSSEDSYEEILTEYIGLSAKNCENVLALHQAGYMTQLYGYAYNSNVELPELVIGDVTRHELAQVASALIGHPYLLGGKSPRPGPPEGPLDCSGFVDWVYIQCFGTGVSSGHIPDGVAVSGTALQWYASAPVSEDELKAGDLAFLYNPETLAGGRINHVGIFIGRHDDKEYFIHCAGRSFGTPERPTGRVGISVRRGSNSYNCVTGDSFEPAMKGCNFQYFRRPNFAFSDE